MADFVKSYCCESRIAPATELIMANRSNAETGRVPDPGSESSALGVHSNMLFMVIERFKHGDPRPVGERFRRSGRMLPEGVAYHASWVDSAGTLCFQVMEAPNPELLNLWATLWDDLVDFEIVPVLTSSDFWSKLQSEQT